MSGRRRHERFSVGQPWEGRLRVVRDVTVLGVGDDHTLELLGTLAGTPGEVVVVELAGRGTVLTLIACVTDSRPVVVEGGLCYAVRVLALDETRRPEPGLGRFGDRTVASRLDVLEATDLVGVLIREWDVHVLNVSGSGCLVESQTEIDEGTTATLTVETGGEDFSDAVRVTRCERVQGAGSRYLVGTEFLWTSVPGPYSVRRAAYAWRQVLMPVGETTSIEPPMVM
jgi:hypothetical protein